MSDALPSLFRAHTRSAPDETPWIPVPSAGAPPYLSRLYVDGFGHLADLDISLSSGLNVVLGDNEAGKSTLFDFITGVLFGFPRHKADLRFHAPVSGGRHGGIIALAHDGTETLVTRHGMAPKRFDLAHEDGSAAEEAELHRLLGGAGKEVWRSVFAIDLDDLRHLDSLGSDSVREVLFSSSILGQRRSAARALQALDARREGLVRPRQGGVANQLLTQLKEVESALRDARGIAKRYPGLRATADRLASELPALREQVEAAQRESRDFELLERSWELVLRSRRAADELAGIGPSEPSEEQAIQLASFVRAARAELSGHVTRLDELAKLRAKRTPLVTSIEERAERLGPWAVAVAADDAVDLDGVRRRLEELLEARAGAHAQLETASDGLAGAEVEHARAAHDLQAYVLESTASGRSSASGPAAIAAPSGAIGELAWRRRSLIELRGLIAERDDADRVLQSALDRHQVALHHRPSDPDHGRSLAYAAAAVLAALGVVLFVRHQSALAAAAAIAACTMVLAAVLVRRHHGRTDAPGDADGRLESLPDAVATARSRFDEAGRRVLAAGTTLGLSEPLTLSVVQRVIDETDVALSERQHVDGLEERRAERSRHLEAARHSVEAAERQVRSVERQIRSLGELLGAPALLEARSLAQALGEVVTLRDRGEALGRIDTEIALVETEVGRYLRRLLSLADDLHVDAPPDLADADAGVDAAPVERLLAEVEAVVTCAQERAARRAALTQSIAATESELERSLGLGEHADALRHELESGEVLQWRERADAARRRVDELEGEYDAAVREHERLVGQLSEIERSDEIVQLESRREELEAELQDVLRQYLTASGARLLVARTLRRYEEERQPAVLERAGDLFAQVTDGRYARVMLDPTTDESTPTVQVMTERGSRLDAHSLSRGTVEQLYLCLRLALAESFAEREVPLPIVLDDVLVNFDPGRAASMSRAIADTAARHQVITFTCHPDSAELLTAAAARTGHRTPVNLVELSR